MPVDTVLYDLLGVTPAVSSADIKKAYKNKAMRYHPDKNPGDPKAAQQFQEIAAAYEILSNEQERAAYDKYGLDGMKNMAQDSMNIDPDLFDQFFGSFGFGFEPTDFKPRKRSEDSVVPLNVSLEDLYNGKIVKMTLEREVLCKSCEGSGAKVGHKPHKCSTCEGKGWVYGTTQVDHGTYGRIKRACSNCHGEGVSLRDKDKCKKCKGKACVTERIRQQLEIEPGSSDGQKIVLKEQGDHKVPGLPAGDVIFHLKCLPHQSFERSGNNLRTTVHLTLSEALTGFSRVLVTHLDGRGVRVSSPKGKVMNSGESIVLRGEGMPILGEEGRGDLFVIFEIEMPSDSWIANIDKQSLLQLLPPKKSSIPANVTSIHDGLYEQADIREFLESEEGWVDEDESQDGDCTHQ